MSKFISHIIGAALSFGLISGAQAAVVQLSDLAILAGAQQITFDDVTGDVFPGTNYDGVLNSGGASFAERFSGQVNEPIGGSDVLSGSPSNPLSLAVGEPGQNVVVYLPTSASTTRVLAGLGTAGFDNADAIGEGSIAALFPNDLAEFGFTLEGAGGGDATLDFFRRDGSLINRIILQAIGNGNYGFGQIGGVAEIAGVSIFNDDGGGIGFDTFRFNVASSQPSPVPEPPMLALLFFGAAVLAFADLKRRPQRLRG